jgi:WD40 repeat protein
MNASAIAARFIGHKESVYALSEGREGFFYSAGSDGWVVEWELKKPDAGRLLARVPGSVYALSFLPEKNMLVVAVNNDGFHFIDPDAGKEIFAIPAGERQWFRMRQMPDGHILACGSGGCLAKLHPEEKSIGFFQQGIADLRGMAVFESGKVMLGSSAAELSLLEPGPGTAKELVSGHEKTIFAISAYPDGKSLVSAGRDARLNLHQKQSSGSWELKQSVPAHLYGIHDVCLHPVKPLLASAGMDKNVKIWDAENLRLLRVLDRSRHGGHSHSVNHLCWLAKPDLLLSCSDDRSILAWDIYH